MKNFKIKTSFVSPGLRPLAADKTGFNLKIFLFDIRGKLSIIRCDKYILYIKRQNKDDYGLQSSFADKKCMYQKLVIYYVR